ncbi:MAG: MBL fold metallo-hydrolase [bacterium]|nr:MBL fold metallo-hydrolase [bacterium]
MNLTFYGAVRTVTGSMFVVENDGRKVLCECGLYQGHRAESNQKNRNFPFMPQEINEMLLSHAHIDHSGNIPTLVKKGFAGSIYTTFASRDLSSAMLRDSAHLQVKDTEHVNWMNQQKLKNGKMNKSEIFEPLYTVADAVASLHLFRGIEYDRLIDITDGIQATYRDAGHILGSAMIEIGIAKRFKKRKILFTGDLGRKNLPILKDPYQVDSADVLIIESTYGNRLHDPIKTAEGKLATVINDTVQRGGKIIVPAFAVGRTQEFVYTLHQLTEQGKIPTLPIYVDSPLAVNATDIFRLHPECFDDQMNEMLAKNQDPFGFGKIKYIRNVEDSKKLNNLTIPGIIISASGMCEGGRILHHLRNNIGDKRNLILVIGFMADGTLGKRLVDRMPVVKIFGEEYELNAQVVKLNSFSAHADRNELLDYIKNIKRKPKQVFIVHGNSDQSEPFAAAIKELGIPNVFIPQPGDKIPIA